MAEDLSNLPPPDTTTESSSEIQPPDAAPAANSSSSSSEDSDDELPDLSSAKEPAEARVLKALNLKDEGNSLFAASDLEKAIRSYRQGVNLLKGLNESNSGDEQVKSLMLSLQNNMAMIFAKQCKWKQCVDITTMSLAIDGVNVKALYRRALANRTLKNFDAAREDIKVALAVDPENKDVRREAALLKKEADAEKNRLKSVFGGAFDKSKGGLYDDLEEEKKAKERRKAEEEEAKKRQQEQELKDKKQKWEDECVSRMARSEPPLSYDEWCGELEAAEKEKKRLKSLEEEENRKKRAAERKAEKELEKAKQKNDSSDDDLDLGGHVRGYKVTADGKKTTFFNNDKLTAETKALIGDIAPKPISATAQTAQQQQLQLNAADGDAAQTPALQRRESGGGSVWNKAGTWEEKDTTEWCRARLKEHLEGVKAENGGYEAKVTAVEEMTGDASVAVIREKKRYLFDFSCKVVLEVKDDEDAVVGNLSVQLPDISSTVAEEGDWELNFKWTKGGKKAFAADVARIVREKIVESLGCFVRKFNAEY